MDVFYAGNTNRHHLILSKVVDGFQDYSLLRFDLYHDDLNDKTFPQGSYVSKLLNGKPYFKNIVWVNKPDFVNNFIVSVYDQGFMTDSFNFNDVVSLNGFLSSVLSSRIFLDVDPVILDGYPWGDEEVLKDYYWTPESGVLTEGELISIINSFIDRVDVAFFASKKNLASKLVSSFNNDFKLIRV